MFCTDKRNIRTRHTPQKYGSLTIQLENNTTNNRTAEGEREKINNCVGRVSTLFSQRPKPCCEKISRHGEELDNIVRSVGY